MIFETTPNCSQFSDILASSNGIVMLCVTNAKYLELLLDAQLPFSEYINYIHLKTVGKVKMLGRLFHMMGGIWD